MKSTGRRFSIGLLFAAARSLCVFNIVNKSCHTSKRPFLILCHLRSKLVQDVSGVETGVVADLAGNDLESLGEGDHDQLQLARDRKGVLANVR